MKLQSATWAWLAAATVSVVLVHSESLREPGTTPQVTASSGAARRVFPGLAEVDPHATTVELVRPNGTKLRFVPDGRNEHHLFVGEQLLGPVEREAVDGLWASLRMAMTVRAVAPGTELGAGQAGMIRILASEGTMTLKLGLVAADTAGVYGVLDHEKDGAWVVDADLPALIEQPEMAWLRRRLLEIEPAELASIAWEDVVLTRGADDLWRVSSGGPPALLSTPAVERRMSALFDANFDVVDERSKVAPDSLRPWLVLTDRSGQATKLALGDSCTASGTTRLVDRGPGRLGCVDASHVAPWPFEAVDAGLVEARLVPYAYGRVLSVEQLEPEPRRLRRQAGGWVVERDGIESVVAEPEVFRWFGQVRGILIEPLSPEADPSEFRPDVELIVETDTTQRLHVRCELNDGRPVRCTRDGAAPRRVVSSDDIDLAFTDQTFADRRLFSFAPGDVAGFEVLPALGQPGIRQSVRQDFGLWRLDHPAHPDAAAAVDLVRLEGLIGVLSSLRADEWLDDIDGRPLRTLRVELRPGVGNGETVGLELFEGCAARVHEGRAVRLHDTNCRVLMGDLLFDDPLRAWLDRAETVVVEAPAAPPVSLRRDERRRLVGEGEAAGRVAALVERWHAWRVLRLMQGPAPTPRQARVTLGLQDGGSVVLDIGDGWAGLADARWFYAMRNVDDVGN